MTDTKEIPLNQLTPWEGNVRRTEPKTGLNHLTASIAAHGLLQSLVVRKKPKGKKYAVIAGGRRLQALNHLAAHGTIPADHPVSCRIIANGADDTEISLTENSVREQMHPADEFEAFRDLIDKGIPLADVAARFGVTETVVRQRLKLARVSPVILDTYRKSELSLAQVMAFAVSDDHDLQEQVLENLSSYNNDPDDIRDALTENDIPATDRRVRFVTLGAYEAAGGKTRRDLFTQDEAGIFILDPGLLDRLVAEKLETLAVKIQAEGWKWVAVRPSYDHAEWVDCERKYQHPVPMTDDQQAEYDALETELDNLYDTEDELTEEQEARADAIRERIEALEDREMVWPPETVGFAGAVITLDRTGDPDIRRGFIRPEDFPEPEPDASEDDPDAQHSKPAAKPEFSASLVENLTAHRSAALAVTLADEPEVALAATVHALALGIFYRGTHADSCLKLFASEQFFSRTKDSPANARIEQHKADWHLRLPEEAEDLWKWCLKQRRDTLMALLAVCAACSINAIQAKADRPDCGRLAHAHDLAEALTLDMTDWFTPTAENYFGKISKTQILDAMTAAKGVPPAPAMAKLKKRELAAAAEKAVAGTDWLPAILRLPAEASSDEEIALEEQGEGA